LSDLDRAVALLEILWSSTWPVPPAREAAPAENSHQKG
jgi:hypothetical protein